MRKFEIVARVEGRLDNFDDWEDGRDVFTFTYNGNKRSSEKSIMRYFKSDLAFWHCKLVEVISFKEL